MENPEDLNRADLAARQMSLLRSQLAAVAAGNRFWQPRLLAVGLTAESLRSLDDLTRLPTLRKAELIADQAQSPPYGTNLTQPVERYTRLHQTSGTTTGQPLRWLDTPQNWANLLDVWQQIYRMLPLRPDHRGCFPFSFGPFLGFWAGFEAALQAGRFAVAAGGMSSEARLNLIADNNINLIGCTPTYALRLAEVAQQQGRDLRALKVDTLLVAGEPGGNVPAVRQRLQELWGADVVDHWGMTEVGPLGIAVQGSRHQLTILETACIAEILEIDRDEPVVAGQLGELVITTLTRTDSPVFRFRTGDLVQQALDPEPHGRALLRLEGGVQGRVDDMLIIRGNNVFPSSIEAVIRSMGEIVEYRLIVERHREMQELQVEIELAADTEPSRCAAIARGLATSIKDRLNFQARVTVVAAGSLPRYEMKARRIVEQSDKPSGR